MDFTKLNGFIKQAMESSNPNVRGQALHTQNMIEDSKDEGTIDAPEISQNDHKDKALEPEDKIITMGLPEMELPDANDKSTFGKVNLKNVKGEGAKGSGCPPTLKSASLYDRLCSRYEKKASVYDVLKARYGRNNSR